ncbi:MAG: glycosyltransferase [Prevotellaceae bacterium]|nr:glycosyltransferase [Prevotellaceae bacterium]
MSRIPSIEEFTGKVITKAVSRETESIDVSIVTVCFNPLKDGRREVFRKNIDSVQQQEDVRLEHLIIDGSSSDGTVEWLQGYSNMRYDIRILSLPDSGIYEAMNRGIALSRGKYVIFLNSDDFFHNPRGMAASVARLEEFGCDFSFAPVRFDSPISHRHAQLAPQKRLHRFLVSWSFSHQSMLTLRSMLVRADGFDTSYRSAADYDLLLRLIVLGAKGCFVPCTFTTFRLGGFSADHRELAIAECIHSLQDFYRIFYSTEMTHEEVAYIIKHRVYPRRYLNIYKHSQRLIRERFIGVPGGLLIWVSRWFNYVKYYLKCLNSSI